MPLSTTVSLIISIICLRYVSGIKILVEPVIYKRFFPYEYDRNFSKDWTDECDVPCVWTGDPTGVDGVFYILKDNWDVFYAYMDKKRAPISIGGSTEARHYYSLLDNDYIRRIFTASSLLASGSEVPWRLKVGDYRELRKVQTNPSALKMAVTAVFNCFSTNGRERMVLEMDQIMPVARIGKCLNNKAWPMCGERRCGKVEALSQYAFCLAFENGNTPGYVSEKVFDCHRAGSIPVYLGSAEVLQFVPMGSIIYAGHFRSAFHLAEHLVEVATNETLFQSYFDWKTAPLDEDFVRRNRPYWDYKIQCRVCRYVWAVQQGLPWDRDTQNVSTEARDLSREGTNRHKGGGKESVRLSPRSFGIEVETESLATRHLSSYAYPILMVLTLILLLALSPYLRILRVRIFSHLWLLRSK